MFLKNSNIKMKIKKCYTVVMQRIKTIVGILLKNLFAMRTMDYQRNCIEHH